MCKCPPPHHMSVSSKVNVLVQVCCKVIVYRFSEFLEFLPRLSGRRPRHSQLRYYLLIFFVFLDYPGADPNIANRSGATALHFAADKGFTGRNSEKSDSVTLQHICTCTRTLNFEMLTFEDAYMVRRRILTYGADKGFTGRNSGKCMNLCSALTFQNFWQRSSRSSWPRVAICVCVCVCVSNLLLTCS